MKNLLREQSDEVEEAFGEFAGTVGAHAGVTWPGATQPRRFIVTGRSTVPSLDRPSIAWLRLRAMFGVGARAEILRCFLIRSGAVHSVAALAERTGYTKRNIAEECVTLERAGVLSVRARGNRFYYSAARLAELKNFVGDIAPIRPNWSAMFNVARELVSLETRENDEALRTLAIHARETLLLIEDDLDDLNIQALPGHVVGADLWPAVRQLGLAHLGSWSVGQWPAEAG